MNPRPDDRRLGCGRDIDELWAAMPHPPDDHERSCAFCQEARASMTPLAEATAQMRTAEREDPALPDPGVLARVMEIARAEVRRARLLPLDEPEPDEGTPELTISEQTVAAVARRAADLVLGVQVRRSRVELVPAAELPSGTPEPAAVVEVGQSSLGTRRPASVRVALQISVASTASIPQATREVRTTVMEAIKEEVGVNPVVVDIAVQDVHDV